MKCPLLIQSKRQNKPHIYTHLPSTPSCHSPLPIQRSRDKPHTYTFIPSTPLCRSYFTLPNHRSGNKQTSHLCSFKVKLSIYRQRFGLAYLNACRLGEVSMHPTGFMPGRLECVLWFYSILEQLPSSHQYCTLHCLFLMHNPPPTAPKLMSKFSTNTRTAQLPSCSTVHIANSPLPITLPSQHHTLPSTYFYKKDKWALLGYLQPQSFYVPVTKAVFLAIPTSQFSFFRLSLSSDSMCYGGEIGACWWT